MSVYLYLAMAIVCEVVGTVSLKAIDGLNKPLPLLLVIGGYGLAFWLLSHVMQTVPVGITYAIWSGLGIVLITIVAFLVYKQSLDIPALLGMALIIAGVIVIQLFSSTSGH